MANPPATCIERPDHSAEGEPAFDKRFATIRLRTYIIGLIAVIGVCIVVAFAESIASRGGSIDAVLLGAIGVIIILVLANVLARRVSKPRDTDKPTASETAVGRDTSILGGLTL